MCYTEERNVFIFLDIFLGDCLWQLDVEPFSNQGDVLTTQRKANSKTNSRPPGKELAESCMNLRLDDWRVWMDAKIINEDEMATAKLADLNLKLEDLRLWVWEEK